MPRAAGVGLVLGFLWTASFAETPNFRFERISIDHGLSQNTVYALLQDHRGLLWFGTGDGLNRYDGHRFEVLRNQPGNPNSLSHNHIRALHEDREGTLWIGTLNGGLNRYDRRTRAMTRYRHDPRVPESLSDDGVRAILEDRHGTLWVGTARGLDRIEPERDSTVDPSLAFEHLRHTPEDPNSLNHDSVRVLSEDRAGQLWIGTQGGLNRLDPTTLSLTRYVPLPEEGAVGYNSIGSIHQDQAGQLWLGTWSGLMRFAPEEVPPFIFFGDISTQFGGPDRDSIWDIHEDPEGRLWLATYGSGVLLFDPDAETVISRIRHEPLRSTSLSGNKVTAFLRDRSDAFWIGTSGNGLNKLVPRTAAFEHYWADPATPQRLSDSMVMAIHEDRDENLWLGTWNGGLNRLDRRTGAVQHFRASADDPTRLSRDDIRAILEDSSGTLWIGAEGGGLHRLDKPSGTFVRYRHQPEDLSTLRDADVWSLFEDRAGTLWVGTYGGGLSRYDPEIDAFHHYRHVEEDPNSLSSNVVRALHQDRAGTLWVGTGRGLNSFDPNPALNPEGAARFRRYRHDPKLKGSLSSDEVLSILEDRGGTLWIGTHGGGLNQLIASSEKDGEPTFRHFTEKHGLSSNVVYGILEDEQGRLWMSTNRGLSRFDPKNESFRNYDVSDGLQSREFNSGAAFKSHRGEMFFGGINGFNAFYPSRIEDNLYAPPVVLTAFKKFDQEVALEADPALLSSVRLLPHENVFGFEFAALSYVAQHKNQYSYRLVGFRDSWTQLGTKRDVTFTHLNPGTYTLEVRASNNDGLWSHDLLSLEVVVEPPFWRTRWFLAVALLASMGLLRGAYLLRTQSIRRHNRALRVEIDERRRVEQELAANNAALEGRNAEMERFVYTVSHDLKTPLVTIKGFLGLLERDAAAGDAERLSNDVARISQAADRMHLLLEDLLELSRIGHVMNPPATVDLTEVAKAAVDLTSHSHAKRDVQISLDPAMPAVEGDRQRLLEVYQNLIDNAIKFLGDQPQARVEIGALQERPDEVLCWVKDNGIGIDPRYQDRVFELFQRLEPEIPGTGVGLALVQRIITVHGGRVWIESEGPGQGCSVYFTLPPALVTRKA